MNEQKGLFKNLYKNLMTPILKNDSGIDAEYLTNLSLSLLSFSSRKYNWPLPALDRLQLACLFQALD